MLNDASVAPTVAVVHLERAKRFYEEELGLIPSRMDMPGIAFYAGGANTSLVLPPSVRFGIVAIVKHALSMLNGGSQRNAN